MEVAPIQSKATPIVQSTSPTLETHDHNTTSSSTSTGTQMQQTGDLPRSNILTDLLTGIDWARTGKDLAAGSAAGMTSLLICYPMDTLRTRLQATDRFNGVSDAIKQTFRHEGLRGFYKGLASPLAAQALQKSIMFGSYGTAKRLIQGNNAAAPKLWELFACGAIAGTANTVVATPIELVRNRLMIQYSLTDRQYRGPVDCIKQIVRQEGGVGALWRGMWPTLCRDSLGVGAYYATFEWARRSITPAGQAPSFWMLVASGATAGVGYWVTAFPLDTIKSVVQTEKQHGRSMLQVGAQLVRQHGWSRLYRGFSLGVARGIPGAAAVFTTHAFVFKALGG